MILQSSVRFHKHIFTISFEFPSGNVLKTHTAVLEIKSAVSSGGWSTANLIQTLPEENLEEIFCLQQYNNYDDLQAFWSKLDDDGFCQVVVGAI